MTRSLTTLAASAPFVRLPALLAPLVLGSLCWLSASCGSSSGPDGTGGSVATGGVKATGGSSNTGGSPNTGGASSTGGSTNTGGTKATGGATNTGGSSSTGGVTNTGGASATGGGAGGKGGTTTGGQGGAAAGGRGGNTSATGGGVGGSSTGGSSGGGSTGNGQCPANATFCSGFEEASVPSSLKAVYYNMTGLPTLDKTVRNSGTQSVSIPAKAGGGEMYLETPAAQSFWFRVYIRTDSGFTHNEHDAFLSLAWPGDDKGVEIVEENCMLTVNDHDRTWGSNGMMTQAGCHTDGIRLDANKWYCLEGFADGGKGDLQIYVGGTAAIQIAGNAMLKHPYASFRFGYREYNGVDRTTWYDDVAVGPQRIGCLP